MFAHHKGRANDVATWEQDSVRLKAIQLLQAGCINRATGLINAVGLFEKGGEMEINICIGNLNADHGKPSQYLSLAHTAQCD